MNNMTDKLKWLVTESKYRYIIIVGIIFLLMLYLNLVQIKFSINFGSPEIEPY